MNAAVNQSQHPLKSYVMKLLYKKDYFTVTKPKLHILGSSFEEEFSITKLSESKMSTYNTCSWIENGKNNHNSSPNDIIINYKTLLGVHEIGLQKLPPH